MGATDLATLASAAIFTARFLLEFLPWLGEPTPPASEVGVRRVLFVFVHLRRNTTDFGLIHYDLALAAPWMIAGLAFALGWQAEPEVLANKGDCFALTTRPRWPKARHNVMEL